MFAFLLRSRRSRSAVKGAHGVHLLEEEIQAGCRVVGIVVITAGINGQELILRGSRYAEVKLAAADLVTASNVEDGVALVLESWVRASAEAAV